MIEYRVYYVNPRPTTTYSDFPFGGPFIGPMRAVLFGRKFVSLESAQAFAEKLSRDGYFPWARATAINSGETANEYLVIREAA